MMGTTEVLILIMTESALLVPPLPVEPRHQYLVLLVTETFLCALILTAAKHAQEVVDEETILHSLFKMMTMVYMIRKFALHVMLHAMNAPIVVQAPEKAVKVDITYKFQVEKKILELEWKNQQVQLQ